MADVPAAMHRKAPRARTEPIRRVAANWLAVRANQEGPSTMRILLKRAYDPPAQGDGFRILVDRLWPRGVSKSSAGIDLWLKDIAPTTTLRKWFGHDPSRWAEFQARYRDELDHNQEMVARIIEQAGSGTITLVYSAKDVEHNDAVVLKTYLEHAIKHPGG